MTSFGRISSRISARGMSCFFILKASCCHAAQSRSIFFHRAGGNATTHIDPPSAASISAPSDQDALNLAVAFPLAQSVQRQPEDCRHSAAHIGIMWVPGSKSKYIRGYFQPNRQRL